MLKIYSIFKSLSGEWGVLRQGIPALFIRLAGCNLHCHYCDSEESRHKDNGIEVSVEEIMEQVIMSGARGVVITGGEPLLQAEALTYLLIALWSRSIVVQIETNGTIPPPMSWDPLVTGWVVDVKLPSSKSGPLPNDQLLARFATRSNTVFKIVCCSEDDYDEAKRYITEIKAAAMGAHYEVPQFCVSPVGGSNLARALADKIIQDKQLHIGLNLQIHKYIWPDGEKGDKALN